MIKDILTCFIKEFKFYFQSGIIYLLIPLYALFAMAVTLYATDFYTNTTVNMYQFFKFQPTLMSLFVPSLTMRFWSDEYKNSTLEVLLSQPVSLLSFVLGKFLAAWAAIAIMLCSSFCLWSFVAWLSEIDNSWIFANYIITFLMVGSLCAVSALASSLIFNGLGSFLISLGACLLFVNVSFSSIVEKIIPENVVIVNLVKTFDFKELFDEMIMGQLSFSAVFYFVLLIVTSLILNVEVVEYKRR